MNKLSGLLLKTAVKPHTKILSLQAVPLCAAGWHESFYYPVRVQLKKIS